MNRIVYIGLWLLVSIIISLVLSSGKDTALTVLWFFIVTVLSSPIFFIIYSIIHARKKDTYGDLSSGDFDDENHIENFLKSDPKFAEMMKRNEEWMVQGDKINAAYNKFKIDKNYEDVIRVYEEVLETGFLVGTIHSIRLADFYIATNQYNKAWGYLNKLHMQSPGLIDKIRLTQYKILKKESKYVDALAFLMAHYMYKNKLTTGYMMNQFLEMT